MHEKLIPIILMSAFLSGCNSEKAEASSPCPQAIFSVSIQLIDAITEIPLDQGTISFVTNEIVTSEDGVVREDTSELNIAYDSYKELYYFSIEPGEFLYTNDIAVYAHHEGYYPFVHKEKDIRDSLACTNYVETFYLCPMGTACR